MNFTVVIPARYASTRLPGKPLADINGKPMIQCVVERALASGAAEVVVATDDERIAEVVRNIGVRAMMTSADHSSGTERLAEVVERLALNEQEIVVNVQGDEPMIPAEVIQQVAENLHAQHVAPMATLAVPLTSYEEIINPNIVKVVTDALGYALYFSRAPIPYGRDVFSQFAEPNSEQCFVQTDFCPWQRHVGLYAYRAGFIRRYAEWPPSQLEQVEQLEQLRVLWQGERIHVAQAIKTPPAGVDTAEDLALVRQLLAHPR